MLNYTDAAQLHAVAVDVVAPRNPYRDGYGPKVPTRYQVQYGPTRRWRRVYVAQYGNAGSAYIVVDGQDLYLDPGVESRLEQARTVAGE